MNGKRSFLESFSSPFYSRYVAHNCVLGSVIWFSVSISIIIALAILLIRAGIELNPGPDVSELPEFGVLTQNCRGLTDCRKTCRLVKRLNRLGAKASPNIVCLQETHCVNRFALDNLFEGSYVIDDGERNQRGVAILIPKLFQLSHSVISGLGRWAIAALNTGGTEQPHVVVVATVYAPNCHRESKVMWQDFFLNLDSFIEKSVDSSHEFDILITGDFNLVLDPIKGLLNRGYSSSEVSLSALIKNSMAERSLGEISAKDNDRNCFTWRRGSCFSKLDYVFASHRLVARVAKATIKWHEFGATFDHACTECKFVPGCKPERGRSFPKLFSTDIATENDKRWIKQQLEHFMQQIPPNWDPHMRLDFIKTMLRSKALELRHMKKISFSSDTVKEQLNLLLSKTIFTREDINNIEALQLELIRIEEQETETLRIKAGVRWREGGEKSTRYFLSKFKARMSSCTMHLLKAGSQTIVGTADLVKFVRIFYSRLYNSISPSRADDAQFAEDFYSNCPSLDNAQRAMLAQPLSIGELKASLKSCKDSAPGLDGIPYSFYKAFSDPMLELLLDSWNHAIQVGELAPSHRRSCLTLLPKKGKDLTQISNWRPISLSSCDLKIITKAYADRLKKVLPHILSEAQAAYVPGRDISFNNRLLNSAKAYARNHDEDFCVVSLDARKAFDSVSHCYLLKTLKAYDFPQEFIQVFQTLYSNLESVVQVNGHMSTSFSVKNGVKQGDALSCGLFVLAMDPLIRNIVKNDFIEGVLIPTSLHELEEIKVLAYADDVSIVCRNGDLQPIFAEYERLSALSGLELNADKTEIFNLIPSQIQQTRVQYVGATYRIGRVEEIKLCGMIMANSEAVEYQRNVKSRIDVMESFVSSWGRRNLTMNGRMILAKTFLLSQIVFPAQFVQICSKEVRKIEHLIYSFVNGARNLYGPEKVARKHLKASRINGGIDGVDVQSFLTAIALRQFGKAAQLNRKLKSLQESLIASKDDICKLATSQLKAGLVAFLRQNPMPNLQELELVSSSALVLFLSPECNAARIASQYNLGNLYSVQRELMDGRLPRQRLNCVVKKLPQQLARLIRASSLLDVETSFNLFTAHDQCELSSTKVIKRALLERKFPNLAVDLNKIHRRQDLPTPGSNEFAELFQNLCHLRQPVLKAIRLKVCYKNIYANERRFRFGLSDSPLCVGCGQDETVEHQLVVCANAARLWEMFKNITGIEIRSMKDLLSCSDTVEAEILKSAVIKALIQIDRNHQTPTRVVATRCAHFLRIEAFVNPTRRPSLLALIVKLNALLP